MPSTLQCCSLMGERRSMITMDCTPSTFDSASAIVGSGMPLDDNNQYLIDEE